VLEAIYRYHDGTKHRFHAFARSLGYLDWASQPNPFRSFHDSPAIALSPRPDAAAATASVGAMLRYSLGISAWKRDAWFRWPLRVNPSSGNLHPTEAYVVGCPGGVYALSAVCTHLGCITRFLSDQGVIACPCHGSRFDLEGNVVEGPAPRPLPWLDVGLDTSGLLVVDTAITVAHGKVFKA